jgi:hypothetical protein
MSDNTIKITLDELLFASLPSSARSTVIEASVTIERIIATMLAMFLDIEVESSKSFGMSTSALSFNHKIQLLIDMKIIGTDEKTLLVKFSEIRNLFAHNAIITHFFQCFGHNKLKDYLEKKYGIQKSKFDFEEDNCKMLFDKLFSDVKQVCRDLFHKMMSRAGSKGEVEGKLLYHEKLLERIQELCKSDPDFCEKMNKIHQQVIARIAMRSNHDDGV